MTILHVEDDPNDVFFLQRAFDKAQLGVNLQPARDGRQALDYLSGKGDYSDRSSYPLPQLMLLDLKLPVINGFEVLSWVRRNEQLRNLPVVILSSSDRLGDLEQAKRLGADHFFTKSTTFTEVVEHVRKVFDAAV